MSPENKHILFGSKHCIQTTMAEEQRHQQQLAEDAGESVATAPTAQQEQRQEQGGPTTAVVEEPAAAGLTPGAIAHDDEEEEQASTASVSAIADGDAAAKASEDEEELVVVNLKFIHRERLSVQCSPQILISDLKQKVLLAHHEQQEGQETQLGDATTADGSIEHFTSIATLRLIYKGKVLKDDQTLASYNFTHEDTVHAVFGRPQTPPLSADASAAADATSASTTTGLNATSSTTATRSGSGGMTTASVQDYGNGVRVGQISIDTDADTPLPNLGNLINSMLSNLGGGPLPDGATASIRIIGDPSSLESLSNAAASTASSSTSSSTLSSSTSASDSSASPVSTSPPPAPSPSVPSAGSTRPEAGAAPAAPSSTVAANATSLLNQAASLRRMMPALELSPLSRPSELSLEMYNVGNALREASDTFLAVHRQLQFVATRFLTENNLNPSERLRLRTRVDQLVSILEHVASMSRAVSSNLAASSYGSGAHPPAASHSNDATERPPSTSPAVPSAPSLNVSPIVNIFGGRNAQAGSITDISNSIADVLQVVNNFRSGSTSAPATPDPPTTTGPGSNSSTTQSSAGGLGDLLNLVSAFTSARPAQAAVSRTTNGSNAQSFPPASSSESQSSANTSFTPPGSMQSAPSTNPSAAADAMSSRPLSDLFSQVSSSATTVCFSATRCFLIACVRLGNA